MENQVQSNRVLVIISKVISGIMTPFSIPFGAFLVLFLFTYLSIMPQRYKIIVLGIVFCFTILMPVLTILLYQRINHFSLKDIGQRQQRFFPYILTIISYVFCFIMMRRLSLPWYMSGIILSALFMIFFFMIANLKWRLSEHMGGMGAIIGGIIAFSVIFGYNPVWWIAGVILLAGVLGSARIISGNHTFGEVVGGFCIGFACAFFTLNPTINHLIRFFFV